MNKTNTAILEPLDKFITVCEEFLQAFADVFEDCQATQDTLKQFRDEIKPNFLFQQVLIRRWHSDMSPFYQKCKDKDQTLMYENIYMLKKLKIQDKWLDPTFSEESKQVVWQYLQTLNKFCEEYSTHDYSKLHAHMPKKMMTTIEKVATDIGMGIQNGNMSLNNINLQQIAESIIKDVGEDEIADFQSNIGNITETLTSMLRNNMDSMSGAMGGMGGGNASGSSLNILDLVGKLSQFKK